MLLVDAANVVGSRPTGWWRDRAGAARDLVARLRSAVAAGRLSAPVVVILEGQGRRGCEEGTVGGVTVCHAPSSGDEALVAFAGDSREPVVAVTADRELRRRLAAVRADCVGPGWLLERLEA